MSDAKIKNFTDLIAWQQAHRCALEVYKATSMFPADERFGLTNQMRRAAVSVTSNVAEGFGRKTKNEKKQFYYIASGSLSELQSQIILARDLGYIDTSEYNALFAQLRQSYRLLNGLISFVS